jgi:hypothetical protein
MKPCFRSVVKAFVIYTYFIFLSFFLQEQFFGGIMQVVSNIGFIHRDNWFKLFLMLASPT